MSELRVLIVVGTFLTSTIILIGWIPSQFFSSEETYLQVNVPDVFDSVPILYYGQTYNFTGVGDGFAESWGKDDFGHDMRLIVSKFYGVYNTHFYGWGLFSSHQMNWRHGSLDRGTFLQFTDIETDMGSDNLVQYTVECSHFYMDGWLAYNSTLYSSWTEAIDNDDANILFGIDFDQVGTTWSAWSILNGLLRFELPTVNVYLNALIAIPLWISIAYVSFIVILRVIGAVFGGGA